MKSQTMSALRDIPVGPKQAHSFLRAYSEIKPHDAMEKALALPPLRSTWRITIFAFVNQTAAWARPPWPHMSRASGPRTARLIFDITPETACPHQSRSVQPLDDGRRAAARSLHHC